MNFREGTRRLALLLGVLGTIAGGFASYLELQSVLSQRARHNKFEQLAASDVVQRECKNIQAQPNGWQIVPDDKLAKNAGPSYKHFVADDGGPSEWDAQGNPISSRLNRGDVRTIHWTKDFRVESLETVDGQTLYPTPAPAAWGYLFIALCPILGFIIPWGTVRAIGWVGAGFFQPSK